MGDASVPRPYEKTGFFLLNLTPFGRNDEFSQNNWDTGRSPEGRSIGHVHDQSAPTGVRMILFICIIAPLHLLEPLLEPTRAYRYISGWLMERWAPPPVANKRYKYLRAVYIEVGHVYALFTFYRLHFHQKLVARFTHPETVTNL